MATLHNRNLDAVFLTAAAEYEPIPVGALVGAALADFSDSYTRTRIRELLARGILSQDESGGPIRLTPTGRTELERLHVTEESEAAA